MRSFSEVLARWDSRQAVAQDCGVTYGVVKQWERRGSVPARYWAALLKGAEARGIKGLSLELLQSLTDPARRVSAA